MCMAKHANPFLSLLQGLYVDSSGVYHAFGPDALHLGASVSARTLWYIVAFGAFGIHVALAHCANDDLRTALREEALQINNHRSGLEPRYLTIVESESASGDRDEKQAGSLSAAAERLQAEADQLRIEAEHTRSETKRLKEEALRLRGMSLKRKGPSAQQRHAGGRRFAPPLMPMALGFLGERMGSLVGTEHSI